MTCRLAPAALLALALVPGGVPRSARAATVADAVPATAAADALRAELAALAVRIEALKKEVAAGRAGRTELQPLLARAQELASQLERLQPPRPVPPAAPAAPDAQELRERADALRDRADRLDGALGPLDARIGEVRRRTRLEESLQSVGGAGEVLAESSPRRAPTPRSGGASGSSSPRTDSAGASAGGVPTSASPPPGTATPPPTSTQPTTPSAPSAPAAPTPDAAARALSAPPTRELEPLLPSPDDSLQELLRKRARVRGDAAALRSQAEALEAEAARSDAVR